jgi:hypothetical protein
MSNNKELKSLLTSEPRAVLKPAHGFSNPPSGLSSNPPCGFQISHLTCLQICHVESQSAMWPFHKRMNFKVNPLMSSLLVIFVWGGMV